MRPAPLTTGHAFGTFLASSAVMFDGQYWEVNAPSLKNFPAVTIVPTVVGQEKRGTAAAGRAGIFCHGGL